MIFKNWSPYGSNFKEINKNLRKLKDCEENQIIVTNLKGSRGVNFKLPKPAHVIIAFEPKRPSDIVQASGRGARSFEQRTSFTLLRNEGFNGEADYSEYINQLNDDEFARIKEEKERKKVTELLHNKPKEKN